MISAHCRQINTPILTARDEAARALAFSKPKRFLNLAEITFDINASPGISFDISYRNPRDDESLMRGVSRVSAMAEYALAIRQHLPTLT